MQNPEIPKENAAAGEKNARLGDGKNIAVTTDLRPPSSSTKDFRFTEYGDVKIYELLKARERNTKQQFPQILFVGDTRFTFRTRMIRNKCASDIKVYEKSGLTLDSIENFLKSQTGIDFAKQTLLICSVGAFDFLPQDEGYQYGMFDLGQRGKDAKTTLCKLFSENSVVLFLPILPVDFTHKLCGQSYAQCTDDNRKEAVKWSSRQICWFNEVLYSSSQKVIQKIMGDFHLYSFESFIDFTQTNTDDGIQLNAFTSNYLSQMVRNFVKLTKPIRYENVIFVGDMRLDDFAKAFPNWQDSSCGIKMLYAINHKLSRIDKNSLVLRELCTLRGSLVVFVLGMSDLYNIYTSVCQECGRNAEFPVVKTFAMPLSDVVSQIYFDMCKAERSLREATEESCEVMFSICYPLDIISCQEYWINDHLKICSKMNIVKPLSSSPIAVERMTEDSIRLIEILNRVSKLHSVRNKIVSWDPLPMIYGENYTKRSSAESKVADVFRDGVNFTPDKVQSVSEQLFNNVQHLNLFSGGLCIEWMPLTHVVALNDLISECSNYANMNFGQKINSSNVAITKNFPPSECEPLLSSPYSSSCSNLNWMHSTAHYNQGAQDMQSSNGGQCVNANHSLPSNSNLVFHGGYFYNTVMPSSEYSSAEAYNSLLAGYYSSNPNVAQNSHQRHLYGSDVMDGLLQNRTGIVNASEYQLSGNTYAEQYYSAYSTPANKRFQTNPSAFTSGAPGLVISDSVLSSVQNENRSSLTVTSGNYLVSSESKVCDESKAALGTLQQHGLESCRIQSKKDDEGDRTTLSESGTPDTQIVPQLPKPKESVEIHERSLQDSRKGDAFGEAQPSEVCVEEKTNKTLHQDNGRRMEVCENPVKNVKQKTVEEKTLSPESMNMDVTRKSSLNKKPCDTSTELGKGIGKSQSYLSILKQTHKSESTLKCQRKDERSISSVEKRKEKENQDERSVSSVEKRKEKENQDERSVSSVEKRKEKEDQDERSISSVEKRKEKENQDERSVSSVEKRKERENQDERSVSSVEKRKEKENQDERSISSVEIRKERENQDERSVSSVEKRKEKENQDERSVSSVEKRKEKENQDERSISSVEKRKERENQDERSVSSVEKRKERENQDERSVSSVEKRKEKENQDERSVSSVEKRKERENQDERSVSSVVKRKEKKNQDFGENRQTGEKRNSSISGHEFDTENMYFNKKEHTPKSYNSDNPASCRYAKQSKLCDVELSPSTCRRNGRALSNPELPRNSKSEDKCIPQLQKRLVRDDDDEYNEPRDKRQNKGTADVFQKNKSECSQLSSYEVDLDIYNLAVINYLRKLKENEKSMSIDNGTFLDDNAKEAIQLSKKLKNIIQNQGHGREVNIHYNQLSAILLETNDLGSNLINSSESNQVKLPCVQKVCQLPIGEANEIIDILEVLRNFGDDLGVLKAPLKIMHEETLKLQAENLDVSRILKQDDNVTFLSLVLHKLELINNSPDQSIVQQIILEEVSERLGILLKNIS